MSPVAVGAPGPSVTPGSSPYMDTFVRVGDLVGAPFGSPAGPSPNVGTPTFSPRRVLFPENATQLFPAAPVARGSQDRRLTLNHDEVTADARPIAAPTHDGTKLVFFNVRLAAPLKRPRSATSATVPAEPTLRLLCAATARYDRCSEAWLPEEPAFLASTHDVNGAEAMAALWRYASQGVEQGGSVVLVAHSRFHLDVLGRMMASVHISVPTHLRHRLWFLDSLDLVDSVRYAVPVNRRTLPSLLRFFGMHRPPGEEELRTEHDRAVALRNRVPGAAGRPTEGGGPGSSPGATPGAASPVGHRCSSRCPEDLGRLLQYRRMVLERYMNDEEVRRTAAERASPGAAVGVDAAWGALRGAANDLAALAGPASRDLPRAVAAAAELGTALAKWQARVRSYRQESGGFALRLCRPVAFLGPGTPAVVSS